MFKAQVLGRLGRDAAVYETANGGKFIAFTLAVNTRNLGKEATYWIDVRSFNPNHLNLCKYLTKGKLLQVGGNYNCGTVTDKSGVVRITHSILADYLDFINLGSGSNNSNKGESTNQVTESDVTTTVPPSTSEEPEIVMNTPTPVVSEESIPVTVNSGVSESDDLPF